MRKLFGTCVFTGALIEHLIRQLLTLLMLPRLLKNVQYSQLVCGTRPTAHLFPPKCKYMDSLFNTQCMIVIVGLCMESGFHCDSGTPCDLIMDSRAVWDRGMTYKIRGVGCPFFPRNNCCSIQFYWFFKFICKMFVFVCFLCTNSLTSVSRDASAPSFASSAPCGDQSHHP